MEDLTSPYPWFKLCTFVINCILFTNTFFIFSDALISDFNSVKFICITTAASLLSRFQLVTISLLALHMIDFSSTCMSDFNNDHRYILKFCPPFSPISYLFLPFFIRNNKVTAQLSFL